MSDLALFLSLLLAYVAGGLTTAWVLALATVKRGAQPRPPADDA